MKFVGTNISSGIINFVSYCPTNCFSFLIRRRVKVDEEVSMGNCVLVVYFLKFLKSLRLRGTFEMILVDSMTLKKNSVV
jgi:hypothetical protein